MFIIGHWDCLQFLEVQGISKENQRQGKLLFFMHITCTKPMINKRTSKNFQWHPNSWIIVTHICSPFWFQWVRKAKGKIKVFPHEHNNYKHVCASVSNKMFHLDEKSKMILFCNISIMKNIYHYLEGLDYSLG